MLLKIDNAVFINTDKIISIDVDYSIDSESWCDEYQPLNVASITIFLDDDHKYSFYHNHAYKVAELLGLSGIGKNLS